MKTIVPAVERLAAAALVILSLSSCDAVKMPRQPGSTAGEKAVQAARKPPRHPFDGTRIALYAGPRYSAGGAFKELEAEFGLVSEGGMLYYPATVAEASGDPTLTAIIALGSPERTVRALERLRSDHPHATIVSIFPADEVLSVEAVSDLVIDVPSSSSLLAEENASGTVSISEGDLSFLLLAASLYAGQSGKDSPLARFDAALDAARKEIRNPTAGRNWEIAQYLDTDTGLKARNHLVIDTGGGNAP